MTDVRWRYSTAYTPCPCAMDVVSTHYTLSSCAVSSCFGFCDACRPCVSNACRPRRTLDVSRASAYSMLHGDCTVWRWGTGTRDRQPATTIDGHSPQGDRWELYGSHWNLRRAACAPAATSAHGAAHIPALPRRKVKRNDSMVPGHASHRTINDATHTAQPLCDCTLRSP